MAATNRVRYETSQYHEHRCRPGHLKSPVGRTGLLCLAPGGCCIAREALTYAICLQLCHFNYNNYRYIYIFFCLASKTLSLLRDVERLKQELKEIRVNMAAAGKQTAINHGEDKLTTEDDDRKNPSYSDAVKVSPKCKEPNKKNKAKRGSSQKKLKRDSRKKQRAEVSGKSVSSSPARSKEFVGRRKLWGTKNVDTEEEIKATLVSKVPNTHGVEVKRVFKNENGRYRWWFWIYGGESVLKLLDEVSFGVYWKIEKKSPFLDSVVVHVLGR